MTEVQSGEQRSQALGSEHLEHWQTYVFGGWSLMNEVSRRIDAVSDLNNAEWRLLEVLASVPHIQISGLADRTQIGMSTVSRQVNRSIEKGHVRMADTPMADARQKWVCITESGRAALGPVLQARDEAVRDLVLAEMSEDELRWLATTFENIRLRCQG